VTLYGGSGGRLALTRAVGPEIAGCELTFLDRTPIDAGRAAAQHAVYELALADGGWRIVRLPLAPEHPDGVFVEDAVVALDEVVVLARPGAVSRRGEVASMERALRQHAGDRPLARIEAPGTLEGGDVLRIGRRLHVGVGGRSNVDGVRQLARLVEPFGWQVRSLGFDGCLHLKTAVTAAAEDLLVANPAWVDVEGVGRGCEVLAIDPSEPFAANVLDAGESVLMAAGAPRTRDRLEARLRPRGKALVEIAMDELAKAEAGVTCCSVLL
jgi:dimethylargininase